jgi:hypothetical protein
VALRPIPKPRKASLRQTRGKRRLLQLLSVVVVGALGCGPSGGPRNRIRNCAAPGGGTAQQRTLGSSLRQVGPSAHDLWEVTSSGRNNVPHEPNQLPRRRRRRRKGRGAPTERLVVHDREWSMSSRSQGHYGNQVKTWQLP